MEDNNILLKKIQEALSHEPRLRYCLPEIYILVNEGSVIVAGSIRSESLKKLVRKIVSSVPGVQLFIEDLKVETNKHHRVGVDIDWTTGSMALS